MKLLSEASSNAKMAKNTGAVTAILHLAPSDLSGYNVCPFANRTGENDPRKSNCSRVCLNEAGRGKMKMVQKARIRKTKMRFEEKDKFYKLLHEDIKFLIRRGKRLNLPVEIRLNGTSDLDWSDVQRQYPDVTWYDYTKTPKLLKNEYAHMVYSRHEGEGSEVIALNHVLNGGNSAVVFDKVPETYKGVKVINGDTTDRRTTDQRGTYVGLRAKGDAKHDTTGFVVR